MSSYYGLLNNNCKVNWLNKITADQLIWISIKIGNMLLSN
ncbi:hypothetical protein A1OE_1396 [Candidatus Endolissoclinum faulkneri L2]|uniref:Uncharacterized protein n=1 Tax=Candidatus Endolissoclinum faulkneri L2 TaxID=1193729 RepID=K7YIW8_9PROT|nr:hypothetical protein A1OE_1396 [Candidatus Endolissoclinum faulkneri L2]